MNRSQQLVTNLLGIALVLSLAACEPTSAPDVDPPKLAPTPSATLVYKSRGDAEAALRSMYGIYLNNLNRTLGAEAAEPGVLRPFLTASQYLQVKESLVRLAKSKRRVSGDGKLSGLVVQQVNEMTGAATAYVCIDVSGVAVLNEDGKDVTSPNRPDQQNLLVKFVEGPRIASSQAWTGASVC